MTKVEIGDATLYLGDCLELLPLLEADAVVTDPPYGIDRTASPRMIEKYGEQSWRDDQPFDPRPWLGIGKRHLFWGAQYFADKLPMSQAWLTWVKRPIEHDFSKDARSYATTEIAWSDWGKARFIPLVWDGGMRGGRAENRRFCHPSQKPIEVMEWCIPDDCDVVLDPYMGSGTTGVAAANLGRRFVGVELERQYFDVACERIEAAYSQQRLFA
jgi:site-specific DNA-methyltransferase (adenine-specific)